MNWKNRVVGARTVLLPALAMALAACSAPSAVAPPGATGPATSATTTDAPPVVPPTTLAPTARPAPTGSAPPVGAPGPIQLIDATGDAASLVTIPGKEMTLVASAAAGGTARGPVRFSVTPYEGGSRAYGLKQAAPSAGADMPWRAGFSANRELGDGTPADAPRRLMQAQGPREVGSEETFWVNTGDSRSAGDRQQACTLMRVTDHAYFYVDKQAKVISAANLDKLASEWEARIFPRVTAAFGDVPRPGIDGEDRIFIVLSPAVDNFGAEKGLMGYFWSRDAIPGGGSSANSNQKEVLFMTDQLFDRPALTSFGTLAHEFQHLINFGQKAARLNYRLAEDTWLDEGLSMYAMEVAGYGLPAGDYHIAKDLRGFQEAPADYSLTDWGANPNGFAYGQSYLFVRYLVDRYGEEALKGVLRSDRAGVGAVEDVLTARGTNFADHFRAWAITNLVSDRPIAAGTPYRYAGLPLAGTYKGPNGTEDIVLKGFRTEPAPGADVELDLKPWGTAYYAYEASQPRTWTLNLAGGAGRLLGAAVVP